MALHIGIAGLPGLDRNPTINFRRYAERYPGVGVILNTLGHDAAAAVVVDGDVVFAVEEERLSRDKHHVGLPWRALEACHAWTDAAPLDVEASFYLHPGPAQLQRWLAGFAPFVASPVLDAVTDDFLSVRRSLGELEQAVPRLGYVEHHEAHAASAFYCSDFDRALVVVLDGHGECGATSVMLGDEAGLHRIAEYPITSSLGLLYADVTSYLGFEAIEDEYKIMGLAAYGSGDDFRPFFDDAIRQTDDGAFVIPDVVEAPLSRLRRWSRLLGPPRRATEPIEPRHIAIAQSLQCALERTVCRMLESHARKVGVRHLCLAGGVALNCSMNGVIDRSGLFDRIFVQPAAHDPGAALGAALRSHHAANPRAPRRPMRHVFLGPGFGDGDVRSALQAFEGQATWVRPRDFTGAIAALLSQGKVIGWFNGRMEFGPRALGARSILADPRDARMKDRVNTLVKKREEFRPFAPSVTDTAADAFFELRHVSQYEWMTIAVRARPERAAQLGAVVHVNNTARVHVVRREINPVYWELLTKFGTLTGVPVLLNTSFNVKGEPIVCTPADALRCFLTTDIDCLAMEGYLIWKHNDATETACRAFL